MGFIQWIVAFVLGGIKALTGIGATKAVAPTPEQEQARAAPQMAATAARDEQVVVDTRATQQAQEASHAQADDASAAAADARARIVRQPSASDSDPAGHWRD